MLAALAGLLLVLLAPVRAWAHAELVESDPAVGATLAAVPSTVTLTFSEEVAEPARIAVTAPNGTQVQDGDAAVTDATVTQSIKPQDTAESAGSWTVAYRVLSIDGHPVTGETTFTVDDGSAPTTATESQAAAPSSSGSSDAGKTTDWYTRATWLVVGIGVGLAAILAWALRRRHA